MDKNFNNNKTVLTTFRGLPRGPQGPPKAAPRGLPGASGRPFKGLLRKPVRAL